MTLAGQIKAGEAFVRAFLDSTDVDVGLIRLRAKIISWQAGLSKITAATMGGGMLPPAISALMRFASSPGGIFAGLGAAAAITAKAGNDIYILAQKAGIATETMSALAYAAKQFKVETQELALGLKNMAGVIDLAARGDTALILQMNRYGISVRALRDLKPEDQFKYISDAISRMTNPTMQAAAAQAIFGRWANELLPILKAGGDAINQWMVRAKELGITIDDTTARSGREFVQLMQDSYEVLMATVRVIGGSLLPSMRGAMTAFISVVNVVKSWIAEHQALVNVLALGVGAIVAVGVAAQIASIGLGFASQAVELFRLAISGILLLPRAALTAIATGVGLAWQMAATVASYAWMGITTVANYIGMAMSATATLAATAFSGAAHLVAMAWAASIQAIQVAMAIAGAVGTATWALASAVIQPLWIGMIGIIESAMLGAAALAIAVWQAGALIVSAAWTALAPLVSSAWTAVAAALGTFWTAIASAAYIAWSLAAVFTSAAWAAAGVHIAAIWSAMSMLALSAWSLAATIVGAAWTVIAAPVAAAMIGILSLISSAWFATAAVVGSIWSAIAPAVTSFWSIAAPVVAAVWAGASIIAAVAWNVAGDFVAASWAAVSGVAAAAWATIAPFVGAVWSAVSAVVGAAWTAVAAAVGAAFAAAGSALGAGLLIGLGVFVLFLTGIPQMIIGAIGSAISGIVGSIGTAIVSLTSAASRVFSKVKDAGANAASSISGSFSSVTSEVGGMFGQIGSMAKTVAGRIASDWHSGWNTVLQDSQSAISQIRQSIAAGDFSSAMSVGIALMKLEWERFRGWIESMWEELRPQWNALVVDVAKQTGELVTSAMNAWDDIWNSASLGLKAFVDEIKNMYAQIRSWLNSAAEYFYSLKIVSKDKQAQFYYEREHDPGNQRDAREYRAEQGVKEAKDKLTGNKDADLAYLDKHISSLGKAFDTYAKSPVVEGVGDRPGEAELVRNERVQSNQEYLDALKRLRESIANPQKVQTPDQKREANKATGDSITSRITGSLGNKENEIDPNDARASRAARIAERQRELDDAKLAAQRSAEELQKKNKLPEMPADKNFDPLSIQEGRRAAGTFSGAAASMMGASTKDEQLTELRKISSIIEHHMPQIIAAQHDQKNIHRAQMRELASGVA